MRKSPVGAQCYPRNPRAARPIGQDDVDIPWVNGHDAGMLNLTLPRMFTLVCLSVVLLGQAFAAPAKSTPPGLPNFATVAPGIYRGAAPTQTGLDTLRAMKVHTIIDLRIEKIALQEKALAEQMGFTWIRLPMGKEAPTQKQVDTLLATLAKADKEPVYVHCQYGADRTGCMIGIYRVQVQHWTFARAWTEMRKYGFKPYLTALKNAVRQRVKS